MQVVQQTDKEKLKMYLKLSKIELAKMLIEFNRIIESGALQVVTGEPLNGYFERYSHKKNKHNLGKVDRIYPSYKTMRNYH